MRCSRRRFYTGLTSKKQSDYPITTTVQFPGKPAQTGLCKTRRSTPAGSTGQLRCGKTSSSNKLLPSPQLGCKIMCIQQCLPFFLACIEDWAIYLYQATEDVWCSFVDIVRDSWPSIKYNILYVYWPYVRETGQQYWPNVRDYCESWWPTIRQTVGDWWPSVQQFGLDVWAGFMNR